MIGEQGLTLIKHFESFRSKSYPDQKGIWTIGYGTTVVDGKPVVPGMVCTQQQATEWMQKDLVKFETQFKPLVDGVKFPQHQYDALLSFIYNAGAGAFQVSTIRKKIRAGIPVSEKNFTDWNKVRINDVLTPSRGLTRRRKAEYNLYATNTLLFF